LENIKLNIRIGNENDIVKVSRLWLQMTNEMMPNEKPNIDLWRQKANSMIKAKNYFLHVAEEGGRIVGFIDYLLFPEAATDRLNGIGQTFYVLPEYRSNGIAAKLWKQAIKNLRQLKADALEIICFDPQVSFWQKRGFRHTLNYMQKIGV
jgi:GNAT superfamily N-acetyltransferase